MKKCIYCKCDISDVSIVDFCERCGKGVWGEKMFSTIVRSMEDAQSRGSLMQGSVGSDNAGRLRRVA